jgi:hypothetical protein
MTNDVPQARFIPPVYRDDEFSEDSDIEAMRHDSIVCPLFRWLVSR